MIVERRLQGPSFENKENCRFTAIHGINSFSTSRLKGWLE
jgi:hypothetical protein